jgi:hypothetical protein
MYEKDTLQKSSGGISEQVFVNVQGAKESIPPPGWESIPELFTRFTVRALSRIFKLLRSPRIDSKEPIPPGCVAWRADTYDNPIPTQFLAAEDCLTIPAQDPKLKILFTLTKIQKDGFRD